MLFPLKFTRTDTTVGTDTIPTGPPNPSTMDNLLVAKGVSINGWPVSRIVMVATAPATATAMNTTLYMWEDATAAWHAINATAVAVTPNVLAYFDVVTLLDLPNTLVNQSAPNSGSISVVAIVSAPGTKPVGTYTFALAPDLTVKGT